GDVGAGDVEVVAGHVHDRDGLASRGPDAVETRSGRHPPDRDPVGPALGRHDLLEAHADPGIALAALADDDGVHSPRDHPERRDRSDVGDLHGYTPSPTGLGPLPFAHARGSTTQRKYSTTSSSGDSGPKILRTPASARSGQSAAGMIPPTTTGMSSAFRFSTSLPNTPQIQPCAPERQEAPMAATYF